MRLDNLCASLLAGAWVYVYIYIRTYKLMQMEMSTREQAE